MNKKELTTLIETIVRKRLNESEYVNDLYDKKFFKLVESFLNSFMTSLQESDNYNDNKELYDNIMAEMQTEFNKFDGKMRQLLKPINIDALKK